MTCEATPEQYDVFKNGEQIGHIRFRFGFFDARFPDAAGYSVYIKDVGDDMTGTFYSDGESRREHLTAAVTAILKANELED